MYHGDHGSIWGQGKHAGLEQTLQRSGHPVLSFGYLRDAEEESVLSYDLLFFGGGADKEQLSLIPESFEPQRECCKGYR